MSRQNALRYALSGLRRARQTDPWHGPIPLVKDEQAGPEQHIYNNVAGTNWRRLTTDKADDLLNRDGKGGSPYRTSGDPVLQGRAIQKLHGDERLPTILWVHCDAFTQVSPIRWSSSVR